MRDSDERREFLGPYPNPLDDATDALDELERRVGEKWVAAAAARMPQWDVPEFDVDWEAWFGTLDTAGALPDDWPQFPREQWARYPAKRTVVLLIADRMLDFDELTDDQWIELCWLMQYGGKTRIA